MKKVFNYIKKKGQSSSSRFNLPSYFGVQTPYRTEGYQIRSKDLGKIHKAALRGDVAKVQQLLLLGKNTVNDLDKVKRTPLHLACVNGYPDVVSLLVERKCELNLLDNDSRTPLMKAIECRQEECATILLEHGADPNLGDGKNNNALHYIASGQTKFMAEKLIKHNIDIEAKNKEGLTPLLLAITTVNTEMANFLLKNGANVNALDNCKRTALMIAISVESTALVTLLLQNNADHTLQDVDGWTAETYVEQYGYPLHIYNKQIEEQQKCHNSCPPQISYEEKPSCSGFALGAPFLDKKVAKESYAEDSISSFSDNPGPANYLLSTNSELDFDKCSSESLSEISARHRLVSINPLGKYEDLKQELKFKGPSDGSQEIFDKGDQEQVKEKNQEHQHNEMETLERKDKLTENRRAGKVNELFSMEIHQHGKDEGNKIPGEEIPITSISSKGNLAPVHHVLKGDIAMHRENIKNPKNEKWISKDSRMTCEKVNSSSDMLLHSYDDSTLNETDPDELRFAKITLNEKKDEVEMDTETLDGFTLDTDTEDSDFSTSNYVQGSCLWEAQNRVLASGLSVKFKKSRMLKFTRKVMVLENTGNCALQETFSESSKSESQQKHQKIQCDSRFAKITIIGNNKDEVEMDTDTLDGFTLDTDTEDSDFSTSNYVQGPSCSWEDQNRVLASALSAKFKKSQVIKFTRKAMALESSKSESQQKHQKVQCDSRLESEKQNREKLEAEIHYPSCSSSAIFDQESQMPREIRVLQEPFEGAQKEGAFEIWVCNGVQVKYWKHSRTLYVKTEKKDRVEKERNKREKELADEYLHIIEQIYKKEQEEDEATIRKLQQELADSKNEPSVNSQELASLYQELLEMEKQQIEELEEKTRKLQECEEEGKLLDLYIKELEDYRQKHKMKAVTFEDSVKQQMDNKEIRKHIFNYTLTQGTEKDNFNDQMEHQLQELKAELLKMKISNEKYMAALEIQNVESRWSRGDKSLSELLLEPLRSATDQTSALAWRDLVYKYLDDNEYETEEIWKLLL
ncbi:uncharacterized protein LOC141544676 [Sminthopsis crassicaudata]|uniref:uncharacterized protein LOC141544676 n=1 Tax=Sminthopsis crassicaudata TaxID=9301 RepID=UPI003D687E59